jgi:membrane protein
LGHGLRNHEAPLAASAMAFNFFLSLIPLLVVLGYLVGQVARRRGVEPLLGPLLETTPEMAGGVVRKEVERMAGSSASLAPIGVAGFLWLASSGTHGLMDVFELALGAPRRPWWKKRALAMVWVLGAVTTLCVAAWGIVQWDAFFHPTERPVATVPSASVGVTPSAATSAHAPAKATVPPHARRGVAGLPRPRVLRAPAERNAVVVAMLALALAGLAAFYRFSVERPPGIRRRAWPGAFVALGGWLLVSWGFGTYVSSLGEYALYYGSLAAVAVLLVWLWLISLALLLGAEVNAQLEGVRDHPEPRPAEASPSDAAAPPAA